MTVSGDPPRRTRRDIQGLRAVAVIAVVAVHTGLPLPGGFAGVDVFFVISGFVIGGLLHRSLREHGRISLVDFYRRRIRRILPAAATLLIVATALSAVLLSPLGPVQGAAGDAASASAIFLANAYFYLFAGGYFQVTAEANPFLHMWSLSVEEQFYLAFPALLILAWLLVRRWGSRALLAVLGLGTLVSFLLCVGFSFSAFVGSGTVLRKLATTTDLSLSFAFYSPVTRAWEFLAGACLAIVATRVVPGARLSQAAAWTGSAAVLASFTLLNPRLTFPGLLALLPVAGALLLILAGSGPAQPLPTRGLSTAPMRWIGDRSYSWYLWHWPLIVFAVAWIPPTSSPGTRTAAATAAAAFSLLAAMAAYRWIEYPIHRGRRLASRRWTVLILVGAVAVPFLAGRALTLAWSAQWWREDIRAIQAAATPTHLDLVRSCSSLSRTLATQPADCTITTPGARGTILLIGDSNAGHLAEAVVTAGQRLGLDVQIVTAPSCPMIALPTYPNPECAELTRANLELIEQGDYAAIIWSAAPSYAAGYPHLLSGPGEPLPADYDEALRRWGDAVARTVDRLSAAAPVIVVDPAPQLDVVNGLVPQCFIPSILLRDPAPGCGTASPSAVDAGRDRVVAAVHAAVGDAATYVDASALQCDERRSCSALVDGVLMYRDNTHLSVVGGLAYASSFERALVEALARDR